MQVKDVLDSEGEVLEIFFLNDMYNIQCNYNFFEYEHLVFSIRNRLSWFCQNRKRAIGPDLPLLLSKLNP